MNRQRRILPPLCAVVLMLGCGDTVPPTEPLSGDQPERVGVVPVKLAVPVASPIEGRAVATTIDVGDDALHSESATSATVAGLSATSTNDFAVSTIALTANDTETAQVFSARHDMTVDPGGALSQGNFAIEFDVLEEAAYEVTGGYTGSAASGPGARWTLGASLFSPSPFTGYLDESDDSVGTLSANFTINGVVEGNDPPFPGDPQPYGSTTGVLPPGRYHFGGGSWIVTNGDATATATANYVITLRPSVRTATAGALALIEELGEQGHLRPNHVRVLEKRLAKILSKHAPDQLSSVMSGSAPGPDTAASAIIEGLMRQVQGWMRAGMLTDADGQDLLAALGLIRNALDVESA